MELFDLVNEKDEIIGTTDKQKSHENGDIHRVSLIYVFSENGDLYVQDHIKSGKLDHSVGGHVTKGESYDDAAKREAFEEVGLSEPITFVSTFYSDERISGVNIRHYFSMYECYPSDNWKFKPNEEVKTLTSMKIEDIVESMNKNPEKFTGGFINSMEEYIKQKHLKLELEKPKLKNFS